MQRFASPSLAAQMFVLVGALTTSLTADTIVLKSAVRLAPGATVVRLADVAALEGATAQSMAEVKVADASTSPFELRLEVVREALVAAQANFAKLDLSGRVCVVRPGATVVSQSAATPIVMPALAARTRPAEAARSIIDPVEVSKDATPLGVCAQLFLAKLHRRGLPLRLECSPEDLAKLAPRSGTSVDVLPRNSLEDEFVEVELVFRNGGQILARDRVRIAPKLLTECAITQFPIARSSRVDQSELKSEQRWLSPKISATALTLNAAAGRVTRVHVAAGATVLASQVKDEVVVHKNDKIVVRREVGLVAIEIDAIAIEEGAIGDMITLRATSKSARGARNAKTSEFTAEITGPGSATLRGQSTHSSEAA
ncbi:MAG: hypothetical protein EXS10_05560 [Phycisphaerales bacterium]|nr:hypothetical protein [Phycisphaerales bacterium]